MGNLWMIDEGNPVQGDTGPDPGQFVRGGAAGTRSVGGRRRIAGARSAGRGPGLFGQSRQPACFHIERVDARANLQGRADPPGFGRDVERRWLTQPADPLAALVAHQVRRPTALVLDLAIGRDLEPLLHPFVGFQLGHDRYVLSVLTVMSTEALALLERPRLPRLDRVSDLG